VVSSFGSQLVAYLLVIFFILRVHAPEASIRDFLGLRPTHPAFYPLGVVVGLGMQPPTIALYTRIVTRFPTRQPDPLPLYFLWASPAKKMLTGAVLVALVPALEEAFFRGALFRSLRGRYPIATVVVVTTSVFALSHVELQSIAPILLVGGAVGILRAASG